MTLLRNLLDRLLLIAAVIAAGLVPGFIAQYRQRLGGMLDQARIDLAPWQAIADQNHHGDLDELVRYHLASSDPTFHAEGGAIALVRDGDRIEIDIPARSITLAVSEDELATRRAEQSSKGFAPAKPRPRKITTALRAYASMTTSAAKGAVRQVP